MAVMATSELLLAPELIGLLAHLRDGVPKTRGQLSELTGLAS
jgi:hypothetical protein